VRKQLSSVELSHKVDVTEQFGLE
jgi:hypothetical protein